MSVSETRRLTRTPLALLGWWIEVLQMEKGGGKGSWSAWKAGELARRYEAKGGDYEDTGENKNKAKKGTPEPKTQDDDGKRKQDGDGDDESAPSSKKAKSEPMPKGKPQPKAKGKAKGKAEGAKPRAVGSRTQPSRSAKKIAV